MWVGGWLMPCPGWFYPGKETRYPLYRRLGGLQSWSGWVWKVSSTPRFYPWAAQPVASHYTYWAIPAHKTNAVDDLIHQTNDSYSNQEWTLLLCVCVSTNHCNAKSCQSPSNTLQGFLLSFFVNKIVTRKCFFGDKVSSQAHFTWLLPVAVTRREI
jgi:hypothetical protein